MFDFCVKNSENSEKMKKGETMAMEKKQPNKYHKVGRINMTISKKAHIKCADILIDDNHLKHIQKKHNIELSTLGMSSLDFVSLIVGKFNEIREAPDYAYNLVLANYNEKFFVAVISMNYNDNGFWEIKTALPIRKAVVLSRKLIWKRERTPLR